MADCEHKKAELLYEDGFIKVECSTCFEILQRHKMIHLQFARKFYANAPDDSWILRHCPMELKFMEEFEASHK